MFATIHRQDELTEIGFKRLMRKHKKSMMKTVGRFVPEHKKSLALAKRFEEQGESYFLFMDKPQVEPTNNLAEREIRTLVLDRLITQGVRSEGGNEWHERFWTVLATCRRLGRNVMEFLRQSLYSVLHGLSPPRLLPK
jgi:transposase